MDSSGTRFLTCLHKPTAVHGAVAGNFLDTPGTDLVLIRDNCLEFYSLDGRELMMQTSVPVKRRIKSIHLFRPSKLPRNKRKGFTGPQQKDWLVVSTATGDRYICTYFKEKLLRSHISKGGSSAWDSYTDNYFASDGKSIITADMAGYFLVFGKSKDFHSVVSQLEQGSIPGDSEENRLFSQAERVDCQFMHVNDIASIGPDEYLVLGNRGSFDRDSNTLLHYKLAGKKLSLVSEEQTQFLFEKLLPISGPEKEWGVVKIGHGRISYKGKMLSNLMTMYNIECYLQLPQLQRQPSLYRWLVATQMGHLSVISVDTQSAAVDEWEIKNYRFPSPSGLVCLSKSAFFMSSSLGDSILFSLNHTGSGTTAQYTADVFDSIDNLGPIIDLSISLDSSYNLEVTTCSGGLPAGSIKKLHYGIDIDCIAQGSEDKSILDCWTLDVGRDTFWLNSFSFGTKILCMNVDGDMEQVDDGLGLRMDEPTKLAFVHEKKLFQVCLTEVRSSANEILFKVKSGAKIDNAIFVPTTGTLYLSFKNRMTVFNVDTPNDTKSMELSSDIVSFVSDSGDNLYIGLWEPVVEVISKSSFQKVGRLELGKNELITSVACDDLYIYAGVATGWMFVYKIEDFRRLKVFDIGTDPVKLCTLPNSGMVVATSKDSYIISGDSFKRINLDPILSISELGPVSCKRFDGENLLLILTKGKVTIGSFGEEKLLVKQTRDDGFFRRISRVGEKHLVALQLGYDAATVDLAPFEENIPNQTKVKLLDYETLTVLDEITISDEMLGECIECMKGSAGEDISFAVGLSGVGSDDITGTKQSGMVKHFVIREDRLIEVHSRIFLHDVFDMSYDESNTCLWVASGNVLHKMHRTSDEWITSKTKIRCPRAITCVDSYYGDRSIAAADTGGYLTMSYGHRTPQLEIGYTPLTHKDGMINDLVILNASVGKQPDDLGVLFASGSKIIHLQRSLPEVESEVETSEEEESLKALLSISLYNTVNKLLLLKRGASSLALVATADGGLYLYGKLDRPAEEKLIFDRLRDAILENDDNYLDYEAADGNLDNSIHNMMHLTRFLQLPGHVRQKVISNLMEVLMESSEYLLTLGESLPEQLKSLCNKYRAQKVISRAFSSSESLDIKVLP